MNPQYNSGMPDDTLNTLSNIYKLYPTIQPSVASKNRNIKKCHSAKITSEIF